MEKQNNHTSVKSYTLKEICDILDVSYRTVLKYVESGRLKGVKIGRNWRISERNLQRFIDGEE